jgi:hypothetical protein
MDLHDFVRLDPDPDPGGQKLPTKIEKSEKFHALKCWMFFLGAKEA